MIRNFETIEDLNYHYGVQISGMVMSCKNVNDEILKEMLKNVMSDYKMNLKILNFKTDLSEKMYMKKQRQIKKKEMQQCKFEIKKMRYEYWQQWKENKRLFEVFKEELAKKTEIKVAEKKQEVKSLELRLESAEVPMLEYEEQNDSDNNDNNNLPKE